MQENTNSTEQQVFYPPVRDGVRAALIYAASLAPEGDPLREKLIAMAEGEAPIEEPPVLAQFVEQWQCWAGAIQHAQGEMEDIKEQLEENGLTVEELRNALRRQKVRVKFIVMNGRIKRMAEV